MTTRDALRILLDHPHTTEEEAGFAVGVLTVVTGQDERVSPPDYATPDWRENYQRGVTWARELLGE